MPQQFRFLTSVTQKMKAYKSITAVIFTAVTMVGCTSLGSQSGSFNKRTAKLSNGIQKAYSVPKSTADRVSPLIIQSAEQHGVEPIKLAAVIRQESSYRSTVVSHAGAIGLTQVMPRFWQDKCPGDLFDEQININCGSYILARYNQSAGSWEKALAYYNVGPTGYHKNRDMKRQGKRYALQVKQHEKDLKGAL